MNYFTLNKMQMVESYFKKHFPEEYEILKNYPPAKWAEKIYWHVYRLTDYPICKNCGNPVQFRSFLQGYRQYCCAKCSNSHVIKKEKCKQTNIERYGGVAPSCNEEIKNKVKQTNIKRYGVEWSAGSDIVQNRIKQTVFGRYGVESAGSIPSIKIKSAITNSNRYGGVGFASQILKEKGRQTSLKRYGDPVFNNREKTRQTNIERYGYEVPNKNPEIAKKLSVSAQQRQMSIDEDLIGYTVDGDQIRKCPHPRCNKCVEKYFIIPSRLLGYRQNSMTELCTRILPIQASHSSKTTIEIFIRDLLDEHNIEYQANARILNGKEIDVYIPSLNIGIECNGTHWHSTKIKPKSYHIKKFQIAKEHNIRLITIWEDQITRTPEIVKSLILNKLGITKNVVYARNCSIKEVTPEVASKFLKQNHIQGPTPTKIRYGLYLGDTLVSLMTFTNSTPCSGRIGEHGWNLNRFCNKVDTRVVGGASKLLKHFIKSHNPDSIVSYSHNDISDGNLYEKLGFKKVGKINTSYYYITADFQRYHRSSFTKSKIVKLGWAENKEDWTESAMMDMHGFYQIYDSGTQKWVWKP